MKTAQVLAAIAQRFPEREALVCGETRITYRAFAQRVDRIAAALVARGVRDGERVGLLLENGTTWIEAFVAIVATGAIAVPISTRLSPAEVTFVVGDAQPCALVFGESHRGHVAHALAGTEIFALDAAAIEMIAADDAIVAPQPPLGPMPDDCMIMYTSGTSGTPKGAIVTHANLLLFGFVSAAEWGLTDADRFLVTTAFAHRTAVARFYNALTLGATLVILDRFDPAVALETIARERVTVAGIVPTIARMLLARIESGDRRCETLRTIVATGEAFPVELKERLFAALPGVALYSFLAMTEAGGIGTLRPQEQIAHAGSVGRPSLGVEVRLVDDDGAEVGAGEVGEITVRSGEPGRFLTMRGYYNRPEETAAALRGGWMHTGDLGRFDDEGYLYVVDRKKDMILSGGLNVYSKEVERALLSHPAVADAAVVGMPDPVFGEAVLAFVELVDGLAASEAELIDHCRERIASYKKPKKIVFGEALPRNAQGKILKRLLREGILCHPELVEGADQA
ncbi:MAG TPA: AMP-binding protein [Candidatus Limnocylindria bacterium]|nr:AMP-binding protein [Candidatus Limnocylindria bacterium]